MIAGEKPANEQSHDYLSSSQVKSSHPVSEHKKGNSPKENAVKFSK